MDIPDILFIVELDSGVCISANTRFLETFDLELDEVVGKSLVDLSVWFNVTQGIQLRERLRRKSWMLLERAEEMADIGSCEFDYNTGLVTGSPGAHRILRYKQR